MFITIQFPIADARPFLNKGTPRLSYVNLTNNYRFVRYFGRVKGKIKNNSPKELAADGYYTSAKCALIMPDLGQYYRGHQKEQVYDSPAILLKPSYLSRRLFTDGNGVIARVEMGLNFEDVINLDGKQCLSVIKDYLTLPTKVPSIHGDRNGNLQDQGGVLAKLLLYATTPTNYFSQSIDTHTVMGCNPILIFEYDEFDGYGKPINKSILPEKAKKIDKNITNDINLSYYALKNKGSSIGVWLIGCNDQNKGNVNLLKKCLLKSHAEREVLKNIVSFITNKIDKEDEINLIAVDDLNDYIHSSMKIISKNKRYSIFQKSIFDAVNQCESIVNNIELVTIENAISNLHRIIKPRRQKEFLYAMFDNLLEIIKAGKDMTTSIYVPGSNNTIISDSIVTDAFKKVQSEHNEDTANAIKIIAAEINKSGNKEAADNFEAFNQEILKPNPKKSLLKTFWQGTIESLPALKELTEAVAYIVKLFI